ncbi:hypothetical protein YM3MPS_09520 [Mycobacterium pseudoshottsii]|nr:Long-chain-fatty-acid--CoA ligase [Mycobacterium sp. 012931]BEH75149.1 hypothetical protein YM3MPS_09520 [Mycobacterium pseudoshottsii]
MVIARDDAPGQTRLVAYYTTTTGTGLDTADIRASLSQVLPAYMVPAAFMLIDELPLTVNGKLDRRALPAPDYTTSAQAYVAPQGPVEETLASLYAQILGVEDRVSAADSFFDLGGDSLSAMRLIAATNTTLHTDLRVADIFDTPTITTLAHRIDTQAQPATIPPSKPCTPAPAHPCSASTPPAASAGPTKPSPPTSPTPSSASTKPSTPTKPHPTPSKPWPATTPPASKTPTPPAPTTSSTGPSAVSSPTKSPSNYTTAATPTPDSSCSTHYPPSTPTPTQQSPPATTAKPCKHCSATTTPPSPTTSYTTSPPTTNHNHNHNHNHNITLYQHHQPHTYTGPTLLIAAEHTPPPNHPTYESTHTKAAYLLQAWQPHLTGPTTTHSTNCTHHQLLHPNHTPTYTNHLKNFLQ